MRTRALVCMLSAATGAAAVAIAIPAASANPSCPYGQTGPGCPHDTCAVGEVLGLNGQCVPPEYVPQLDPMAVPPLTAGSPI
jgi:hypothetical protein